MRSFRLIAPLALALGLTVTACGSEDGSADTAASTDGGLTEVTVSSIPIAPLAPLAIAQRDGLFEQEGLRVKLDTGAQGSAASVSLVQSGEADIGFADVVPLFIAAEKGIGLKLIAPGNAGGGTPESTYSAVVSKKGSGIDSYEDLAGTTIGVNALNNIGVLTITEALEREGVDTSGIDFVEVPIPQLGSAVEQGRVDAANVFEPFLSSVLAKDGQVVFYNYVDVIPDGALSYYFTSTEFAEEHPDVVDGFARAMSEATAFAAEHPKAIREVIPEFTEIPEGAAQEMVLPAFDPEQLGPEALEVLAGLLQEAGLLEEQPDLEELLRPAP